MERAASETRRIAVVTGGHGRGSNLKAIHRDFMNRGFPARVELVVGTRKESPVRDLCASLCLSFEYVSTKSMSDFEHRLSSLVRERRIELIALAGFLKLLSAEFLEEVAIPVLNIHPALIPKHCGAGMYGMKVHASVFAMGDKISGATVHEVDPIYDHGRIIAQQTTDISACRGPEDIAARVLSVEHQLYAPAILKRLSEEAL